MKKQRVLITGIHGFTGRYMATEMTVSGYQVFGMGTAPSSETNYFQTTLGDKVALAGALECINPDIVIHLAALAFVAHSNVDQFYQVNLLGTRNLLDALTQLPNSPKAVLLASSANVYGNTAEGMLAENTKPNPANDYALSKLAMEYLARLWMDKLPIIITRPFNYTGVGQTEHFLLPKIVSHFKKRALVIELGNLDVWRDFSDVRSVVKIYRRLIEAKVFGQTINVCSGKTHSLQEVLSMCEQITGHKIEKKINPTFIRANEVRTLCGDAQLLRNLIGSWQTYKLEETLSWMLQTK
jgi:nucleoside-diphosphate-sugar epimerase